MTTDRTQLSTLFEIISEYCKSKGWDNVNPTGRIRYCKTPHREVWHHAIAIYTHNETVDERESLPYTLTYKQTQELVELLQGMGYNADTGIRGESLELFVQVNCFYRGMSQEETRHLEPELNDERWIDLAQTASNHHSKYFYMTTKF